MMMRAIVLLGVAVTLSGADKYSGPRPPKPDVPYLLHANKLVETEGVEAREQSGKDGTTFSIPGAASSAKTPLAEPIFLIETDHINPNSFELFRLEVRGGNREVIMPAASKRRRNGPRPLRLAIHKIGDRLYRIEANEALENGQYSLSPSDSNKAFCFEVY